MGPAQLLDFGPDATDDGEGLGDRRRLLAVGHKAKADPWQSVVVGVPRPPPDLGENAGVGIGIAPQPLSMPQNTGLTMSSRVNTSVCRARAMRPLPSRNGWIIVRFRWAIAERRYC